MIEHRILGENLDQPPCRSLEKLEFSYFEYDVKESEPPYFTVSIIYVDAKYREILRVRAFDVQSMLGNIGGYIGIFIGYALLNIPDALMRLVRRGGLGTRHGNKEESGVKNRHDDPEKGLEESNNSRLVKLEEQVEQLQQKVSRFNGNGGHASLHRTNAIWL